MSSVHGPPRDGSGHRRRRRDSGGGGHEAAGWASATALQRRHHPLERRDRSRAPAAEAPPALSRPLISATPSQTPHPGRRAHQGQQDQPPPPVDGGRQLADRVQHPGNASGRLGAGAVGTPLPPARHDWRPVSSPPPRVHATRAGRGDRRLVRRRRARPAVAAAGRDAVGRAGQRGDAPADAGGPGRAGLAGLDGALADARRPGGRAAGRRRCGRGTSSATRAGRCGCRRRHGPSSSGTAAWCPRRRRAAGAARRRPYTAAAVACFAYGQPQPSSTPTCAGSGADWCTGGPRPATRRRRAGRIAARPRRDATAPPGSRWRPWSSAHWSASPARRAAGRARSATAAPGRWPLAGARRAAAAGAEVRGTDRQVRGRLIASSATRTPRCRPPTRRRLGRRRPARPLPGLALVDGLVEQTATASSPSPELIIGLLPRDTRGHARHTRQQDDDHGGEALQRLRRRRGLRSRKVMSQPAKATSSSTTIRQFREPDGLTPLPDDDRPQHRPDDQQRAVDRRPHRVIAPGHATSAFNPRARARVPPPTTKGPICPLTRK